VLCGRSLERRAFWIESEGDFELDSTKVEACLLSTVITLLLWKESIALQFLVHIFSLSLCSCKNAGALLRRTLVLCGISNIAVNVGGYNHTPTQGAHCHDEKAQQRMAEFMHPECPE